MNFVAVIHPAAENEKVDITSFFAVITPGTKKINLILIKKLKKLKPDNDYELVCNELLNEFYPSDTHFRYYKNEYDCFIRPDKPVGRYIH